MSFYGIVLVPGKRKQKIVAESCGKSWINHRILLSQYRTVLYRSVSIIAVGLQREHLTRVMRTEMILRNTSERKFIVCLNKMQNLPAVTRRG